MGGGYFVFTSLRGGAADVAISPTPALVVSSPSITSAANPDLIGANWKTYVHSNFQLNYPLNWDFYKMGEDDVLFGPTELVKVNRERLENPDIAALIGGKAWPVSVGLLKGDIYYYGPNKVSFTTNEQANVTSKRLAIEGLSVLKHIIEFKDDAPYITKGDIIEVVVIKKGNNTYAITLSDQNHKDIYDQILSTFKFIE